MTLEPVMSLEAQSTAVHYFLTSQRNLKPRNRVVVTSPSKMEPYQPFCSITDAFKRSCTYLCARFREECQGFLFCFCCRARDAMTNRGV